jgi:type I restriction-modification system DNA methylase subunit
MDKTTAQRLVSETFKAAFDKKRYRDFINELCNGFNEAKAQIMSVPDAFTPHVKSCQRLGTFESADGELADVLIVHLTESWKLERTRTALRDFVAHKLKRGDNYKEAGLVAFVAPDEQSWRFSFVRMEYETKRDPKTGKIKTEERLTPARRYSYIVGVDEECHTAQSRFLPLLQNTTAKPALSQIEEAFSVESVTKEFFTQYAALFNSTQIALDAIVKKDSLLRADFTAKKVSTADFCKKLLGQIVFLYFIQKKGWLGVPKGGNWGDGPRNFLRQLADRAISEKKCLFNDVLEPLFYDTLATDRGYDAWCKVFACRIPFLNGGLFEPLAGYDWENTNISFTNSLFSNQDRTPAGDVGSGILDVFDRYNFTVNESEPLEKEVAIDPEMLGKVFENLIEENRRKGLGAFYTPREIVHYMCQESLINYLDNGLNNPTKPRTGKPIAVPRKDVEDWIRQSDQFAHYAAAIAAGTKGDHYPKPPESIRTFSAEIDVLLRDITVCDPAIGSGAFPVGMMTEIVRARVALTPYFNDVAERTPYYFKRHAIQSSIYGADIDAGAVEIAKLRLWLSLVVDEEDIQQIKPLPNLDYKIVVGNSLFGVEKTLFNNDQFKQLETLKPKFFDESNRTKKAEYKRQIEKLIHELTNGREAFDFEIYFSEVFHANGGFDVVIANPPYVQIKDIPQAERRIFEQRYDFATGRFNLFYLFIERIKLLSKADGTNTFIIPDRLLLNTQCKDIRHWLLNSNTLLELVSFAEQVFETAVVDSIVLLFQKSLRRSDTVQARRKVSGREIQKAELLRIPFGYFELSPSSQFDLNYSAPKHGLISKVRKTSIALEAISETKDGIIQGKVEDLLFLDKYKNSASKRLLFGENITTYTIRYADNWVNYAPDALMKEEIKRRGPDVRPGLWMRNSAIFERSKILTRQTADRIIAAFDENHFYYANTLHGTTITDPRYNPRYVLGVLNSKITTWFYRSNTDEEGKVFAQIKIELLRKLPIPRADKSAQNEIVKLVEQIEAAKATDPTADVSKQTSLINAALYRLYNLSPEEIVLVESAR